MAQLARWILPRTLLLASASMTIVLIGHALVALLTQYPAGVDLEIPLGAATRFANGGEPYLSSAFDATAGPDLPFLYPPVTLPMLVPLLALPRELVFVSWAIVCLGCAAFACRRLGIPWWSIPIVLAWPPFAEALIGGNVQVLLFAWFTAIFWTGSAAPAFTSVSRDITTVRSVRAVGDGLLATAIGAIKVSQAHAWLFMLRHRPGAAAIGAAIVIAICVLTLPLVGLSRWTDWLSQASRSGDPAWPVIGWPVSVFLGRPIGLALTVLSLVAVLFVPTRRAGAWLGVLSVIGAPSLHMFGLLFLLPAMLEIRRDVAIVAAMLIATYTTAGVVGGAALIGVSFALSSRMAIFASRPRTAASST